MEIRHAEAADIPAIAALEADTFSLGADEGALERMRTGTNSVILCAADDEDIVGYAYFQFVLDEGYVGNLAVREDRRRQGIGAALTRAMLADARERELSFLTLEVRESNIPARTLYGSRGFHDAGVRKKYYARPEEDAVLMTADLKGEGGTEC